MVNTIAAKVDEIIRPTLHGLQYDCVGVEIVGAGRQPTVVVYIEGLEGNNVTVGELQLISGQLGAVLDVAQIFKDEYRLEISSPGLDRLLTRQEHYVRFVGKEVNIKTHDPIEARRNFRGVLQEVSDTQVRVLIEGKVYDIPLSAIEKARLVPEF